MVSELEDVFGLDSSAWKVWSDWRRVRRGSLNIWYLGICFWFFNWRTSLLLRGSGPTGEEKEEVLCMFGIWEYVFGF